MRERERKESLLSDHRVLHNKNNKSRKEKQEIVKSYVSLQICCNHFRKEAFYHLSVHYRKSRIIEYR